MEAQYNAIAQATCRHEDQMQWFSKCRGSAAGKQNSYSQIAWAKLRSQLCLFSFVWRCSIHLYTKRTVQQSLGSTQSHTDFTITDFLSICRQEALAVMPPLPAQTKGNGNRLCVSRCLLIFWIFVSMQSYIYKLWLLAYFA